MNLEVFNFKKPEKTTFLHYFFLLFWGLPSLSCLEWDISVDY